MPQCAAGPRRFDWPTLHAYIAHADARDNDDGGARDLEVRVDTFKGDELLEVVNAWATDGGVLWTHVT